MIADDLAGLAVRRRHRDQRGDAAGAGIAPPAAARVRGTHRLHGLGIGAAGAGGGVVAGAAVHHCAAAGAARIATRRHRRCGHAAAGHGCCRRDAGHRLDAPARDGLVHRRRPAGVAFQATTTAIRCRSRPAAAARRRHLRRRYRTVPGGHRCVAPADRVACGFRDALSRRARLAGGRARTRARTARRRARQPRRWRSCAACTGSIRCCTRPPRASGSTRNSPAMPPCSPAIPMRVAPMPTRC